MFRVVIFTIIHELSQKEHDYLLTFISNYKQERVKKFHFFRDARNCLLGDCLARIEICRATGLSNNQLEFSTNAYGKPVLVNNPHIHFNISHAGNYITCAIASKPVGIDVEVVKHIDLKVAERFFTSCERSYITNGNQIQRFFEVWTKKESQIKWEGKGLHKPLDSFSVFDFNEQKPLFYHKIFQNDEAICHACSEHQAPPHVEFIDTPIFMRSIM